MNAIDRPMTIIERQPASLVRATAPIAPMLRAQARAQAVSFWRTPAISLTGLLLPIMLFAVFILPHAHEPWQGSITVGAYMLAAIGAYAVSSVMVFNFGVTVAIERGQKVDLLMRAMPLPGWVYLAARVIGGIVFAVIALAALVAVAIFLGDIRLEATAWISLITRLLLGSIPFIAFGFAIAYLAGPTAAPAVANLLFIGMAFASGMFVRLDQMPDFLRSIAPLLPTYHYAQLAWGAIGAASESTLIAGGWLVGYGVALFALAAWAYRRESERRFA
jgi:ABC-2 type transport system permease protein